MHKLFSVVINIFGGVFVAFIFFITSDNILANLGLNSLLFPLLISVISASVTIEERIVDAVFPLVGIIFYLLISLIIIEFDVLYGSYPVEYGMVLFVVSAIAAAIWTIYYISILILKTLLNQAKQNIGKIVADVFQMLTIIYVIYRFYQIKRNILFGLTGTAAFGIYILLHIYDLEYLPLNLISFAIVSLIALLPFHLRNTRKNSKTLKRTVRYRSRFSSIKNKLLTVRVPRPWKSISKPNYSVSSKIHSRCRSGITIIMRRAKSLIKVPLEKLSQFK